MVVCVSERDELTVIVIKLCVTNRPTFDIAGKISDDTMTVIERPHEAEVPMLLVGRFDSIAHLLLCLIGWRPNGTILEHDFEKIEKPATEHLFNRRLRQKESRIRQMPPPFRCQAAGRTKNVAMRVMTAITAMGVKRSHLSGNGAKMNVIRKKFEYGIGGAAQEQITHGLGVVEVEIG